MEKDQRKWACIKLTCPREVYDDFTRALELAKRVGLDVGNDIEALSMILAEFISTWSAAEEQRKREKPLKYQGVYERDEWRCQYPGCERRDQLTTHHIKPRSLGGRDSMRNLIILCMECHDAVQQDWSRHYESLTCIAEERSRIFLGLSAEAGAEANP